MGSVYTSVSTLSHVIRSVHAASELENVLERKKELERERERERERAVGRDRRLLVLSLIYILYIEAGVSMAASDFPEMARQAFQCSPS